MSPRRAWTLSLLLPFSLVTLSGIGFCSPNAHADQVQAITPIRNVEPPPNDATAETLEERGDSLRAQKLYLDALDYYRAALAK